MNRRALEASATLAFAASLIGAPASPAVEAACDPATQALQYLSVQQKADGSVDAAVGETLDFVLGAAASGYDPRTLTSSAGKTPYDWLAANLAGATLDANRTGKLVQAVVAGRLDPHAFAAPDLLPRLEGPGGTSGGFFDATTGAFDTGPNAAIAQANALLGLKAAGDTGFPVTAQAVTRLHGLQQGDGAWQSFSTDDSNATALALMALAAVGDHSADSAALTFLHTQQDPLSGGFAEAAAYGSASDPDSDALVIDGLLAAGQDPAAAAWSNANGNAVGDLPGFQDLATGGFFFSHTAPVPDAFTTSQVATGLRQKPLPRAASVCRRHRIAGGGGAPRPPRPSRPRPTPSACPSSGAPMTPPAPLVALPALAVLVAATMVIGLQRRRP